MKSTQTHIAPHASRFAPCGVRCDDGGLALGAYYVRPAVGRDEPSPAMAEKIASAVDLYSRVRGALAPCSRGVVVTDDDESYLSGHGEYEDRVFFGDIAVTRCLCCPVTPILQVARALIRNGLLIEPVRIAAEMLKRGVDVARCEVRYDSVVMPGYRAGSMEMGIVNYPDEDPKTVDAYEIARDFVDGGDWGDGEPCEVEIPVYRPALCWDGSKVVETRADESFETVVAACGGAAKVACRCRHCVATTLVRNDKAEDDGWGTSDDGEWYCPDCLDYSCDEDGQPLCSAHDIPEISWGRIQTGGAGVSNWQTGTSADGRRWRREDHGGRNSTQWTAPVPIGDGADDGEDEG